MAALLHLNLFGSMSIHLNGHPAPALTLGGRMASLLAFLALARGRFFSRSELCAVLWADRGDTVNPGAFNTTLWRLRRALEQPPLAQGSVIGSDGRGGIGLLTGEALLLDIEEFQRLTGPGLAHPLEALTEADIAGLRAGVALYKADILCEFNDDWALREREKQRRTYLNAHGRLMKLAALGADHPAGIRHAQAILDCDPLREDIHRELMRLYVLAGQRALALRQFEYCRGLLKRELAIQPMPETVALYQHINAGAIGTAVGSSPMLGAAQASLAAALLPSRAPDPRDQIEAARRLLAEADAQLQRSLRQLES
ncbi:bacterial transcriptional activator domain-containing protein [Chitiniphilus purpureus]|uniref:Bacterial transcriptional activator domain-containing protein n=1 Tax=Chitiniphilus purpureus TaxID=2981137 RepID=A0ABY6DJH3_9NEIS|nr:bacterial transcriptional activator domain-containing protein [Chitiniphilus sp. CD1]UXY14499.1 bacterial transcriptional activator domain-containing protein [Chitiniphilus sp. CD1]